MLSGYMFDYADTKRRLSRRAGAHWNTSATPAEPMVADWDVQTYAYWVELLAQEATDAKLPKSGLKVRTDKCYDHYNNVR